MLYYVDQLGDKKQVKSINDAMSIFGFSHQSLSYSQKGALSYLITTETVSRSYGATQAEQLLKCVYDITVNRPTSFDDMATRLPPSVLLDTNITKSSEQEILYRIANTTKRNMSRLLLTDEHSSTLVDRDCALLGFCKLSDYIFKMHNKHSTLYVTLGRSPTPIAAWLANNTKNLCMLPFSSARLDEFSMASIVAARSKTKMHFDRLLKPYLSNRSLKEIVLIDYATSGESIFTAYGLIHDYLDTESIKVPMKGLSLWADRNAQKTASISASWQKWEAFAGYDRNFFSLFSNGKSRIQHLYIAELVTHELGVVLGVNKWSKEHSEQILFAMMDLLGNQSFDVSSPYGKTPVLRGVMPAAYMDQQAYAKFIHLQKEMFRAEREAKSFQAEILQMQPDNFLTSQSPFDTSSSPDKIIPVTHRRSSSSSTSSSLLSSSSFANTAPPSSRSLSTLAGAASSSSFFANSTSPYANKSLSRSPSFDLTRLPIRSPDANRISDRDRIKFIEYHKTRFLSPHQQTTSFIITPQHDKQSINTIGSLTTTLSSHFRTHPLDRNRNRLLIIPTRIHDEVLYTLVVYSPYRTKHHVRIFSVLYGLARNSAAYVSEALSIIHNVLNTSGVKATDPKNYTDLYTINPVSDDHCTELGDVAILIGRSSELFDEEFKYSAECIKEKLTKFERQIAKNGTDRCKGNHFNRLAISNPAEADKILERNRRAKAYDHCRRLLNDPFLSYREEKTLEEYCRSTNPNDAERGLIVAIQRKLKEEEEKRQARRDRELAEAQTNASSSLNSASGPGAFLAALAQSVDEGNQRWNAEKEQRRQQQRLTEDAAYIAQNNADSQRRRAERDRQYEHLRRNDAARMMAQRAVNGASSSKTNSNSSCSPTSSASLSRATPVSSFASSSNSYSRAPSIASLVSLSSENWETLLFKSDLDSGKSFGDNFTDSRGFKTNPSTFW